MNEWEEAIEELAEGWRENHDDYENVAAYVSAEIVHCGTFVYGGAPYVAGLYLIRNCDIEDMDSDVADVFYNACDEMTQDVKRVLKADN